MSYPAAGWEAERARACSEAGFGVDDGSLEEEFADAWARDRDIDNRIDDALEGREE